MDANAALQHVLKRQDVDTSKIVLVGKSLGGAVALHTAAKHETKLRAAIVENTFLGVEDMVPKMFPFLSFGFGEKKPLNFLVRNKWSNKEQITTLKELPILMIASERVCCPRPLQAFTCQHCQVFFRSFNFGDGAYLTMMCLCCQRWDGHSIDPVGLLAGRTGAVLAHARTARAPRDTEQYMGCVPEQRAHGCVHGSRQDLVLEFGEEVLGTACLVALHSISSCCLL